jgi:hypothetical protein
MHDGNIVLDALPFPFRKHFSASAFSRSVMSELFFRNNPPGVTEASEALNSWLRLLLHSTMRCFNHSRIPRGLTDKVLAHQDPLFVGPGLSAVFSDEPQAES